MIKCNLAEILARKGLKIKDLAKNTGVSRTTLTALFYNQGKGVQFETMDLICLALEITPGELFSQYTAGLMIHERKPAKYDDCYVLELDAIINGVHHSGNVFCGLVPEGDKLIVAVTVKFLNKLEEIPNNHFLDLVYMAYSGFTNIVGIDSIPRELVIIEENDDSFKAFLD